MPNGRRANQVRATRGVYKGTWYFEIRATSLGETGHLRLGWCTKKGELQVYDPTFLHSQAVWD